MCDQCCTGTDCTSAGWKYVWWTNNVRIFLTSFMLVLLLTGCIIMGARGDRDQECSSNCAEQKCEYDDYTYDCTCTDSTWKGHCDNKSWKVGSAGAAGASLAFIGGIYVFIQLARMCCCSRPRSNGGLMPQPVGGYNYGTQQQNPAIATPVQAMPLSSNAPQQTMWVQMPNGTMAQVQAIPVYAPPQPSQYQQPLLSSTTQQMAAVQPQYV
eukprot:TRINITY_DN5893_c0_g1_i1.p1 TRINITY_DN5893_c0_g1~~TRINITY_DN5893_c0_g1_i1.p1  ORF type:complete len:211 (-),score=16.89 TRINITY_DN5893_c0_g1_i1:239-871(-)